jgi:hypothetical protein
MRLRLVLCDDWHGNTGCLVAEDLALLTKIRTLIHEEISLPWRTLFPLSSNDLIYGWISHRDSRLLVHDPLFRYLDRSAWFSVDVLATWLAKLLQQLCCNL